VTVSGSEFNRSCRECKFNSIEDRPSLQENREPKLCYVPRGIPRGAPHDEASHRFGAERSKCDSIN
jgi:hypothetical protein